MLLREIKTVYSENHMKQITFVDKTPPVAHCR
jgi:hypothetical protein